MKEGALRAIPFRRSMAQAPLAVGFGRRGYMGPQSDIDAVLNEAQSAVNALADDVGQLSQGGVSPSQSHPASPRPVGGPALPARAAVSSPDRLNRILRLKVPVVVRLADRTMSVSEIMKITPGTILEFARGIEEDLDLLINNHQIGNGVAVKVNEHFGLRLTYVGDVRKRIDSLMAS